MEKETYITECALEAAIEGRILSCKHPIGYGVTKEVIVISKKNFDKIKELTGLMFLAKDREPKIKLKNGGTIPKGIVTEYIPSIPRKQ